MVRSRASHRLSWPMIMFSQSGVFASSKSASHTFAPELSALMVIFRSVGPVISTRRSTRPGAGAGTCQRLSSLMWRGAGGEDRRRPAARADSGGGRGHLAEVVVPDVAGLGQEVQHAAGGQVLLGGRAGRQQLRPLAAELTLERGDQAQRVRGEDLLETISGRAKDLNAITSRHLPLLFCAGMWN